MAVTSLRTLCEETLADLVLDKEWDRTSLPAEHISSVHWMALMRSIAHAVDSSPPGQHIRGRFKPGRDQWRLQVYMRDSLVFFFRRQHLQVSLRITAIGEESAVCVQFRDKGGVTESAMGGPAPPLQRGLYAPLVDVMKTRRRRYWCTKRTNDVVLWN
jgi:hypothetical protein